MTIYYVDYENVNSQGLKGVEHLTENDEVNILYSKKADNVKIDILTALMASKASIRTSCAGSTGTRRTSCADS